MTEYFKFYWNHRALNKISLGCLLIGTFLLLNVQLRYEYAYEGFGSVLMAAANMMFTFTCVYQGMSIIEDTKNNNQMFIRLFVNPCNYVLMQVLFLTLSGIIFSLGTFNPDYETLLENLIQASILFPMYLAIPIFVSKGLVKSILFIIKTNVVLGLTTGLLLVASADQALTSGTGFEIVLLTMVNAYMLKNFFDSVAGGYYE